MSVVQFDAIRIAQLTAAVDRGAFGDLGVFEPDPPQLNQRADRRVEAGAAPAHQHRLPDQPVDDRIHGHRLDAGHLVDAGDLGRWEVGAEPVLVVADENGATGELRLRPGVLNRQSDTSAQGEVAPGGSGHT
ncbi:hypothetical protein SDC9_173657 [bioreactor metagenome]|uniref:Uncharacterized protein n=1 Tax=bioreactor metagenome TaxID=1076179 RepID=A0A645GRH7_9ZZZZ